MVSSPTACFRFAEVGRIAMHNKDHVACLVGDDGILMGCLVVKENFVSAMVCAVGADCMDAMELNVVSMVESTAWP